MRLVDFSGSRRAGLFDAAGLRPGGDVSVSSSTPATTHAAALLRTGCFSVQPVAMSVIVSVRANSPI